MNCADFEKYLQERIKARNHIASVKSSERTEMKEKLNEQKTKVSTRATKPNLLPKRESANSNSRSSAAARRPSSPPARSSSKNGRVRAGPVSYRTSRLPSPTNNNKSGKSSPFLLQYSRKRSSNLLPPLGQGDHQRTRRSRVRTVPNSRANSSKFTRLEVEPVLGKRSRSASEEVTGQPSLEVRGTESLLQFPTREPTPASS